VNYGLRIKQTVFKVSIAENRNFQKNILALSQNCEKRLLALSWLSVRLSVRMEQLGCHRTDFH